ncbi:YciI family protein [Campylobacter sp. 19-13652]|uniref:YciI family protein n=1 Tax=Campylobacter sp. 19-13652 TaxID=2840180 RepID=UPI001C73EFB0|nr:YciI family protein [Campylobacter sp. 19-13652]BCX80178.1 hypothetical protein LBC_16400 [Campylobacter sp. 19-13652]
MYIISIKIKAELLDEQRAAELLAAHRQWFTSHFQAGDFLLLGPYLDEQNAGVIIAKAPSRAALDEIIAGDVYYPELAEYEVREFRAAMAVSGLNE